MGAGFNFITYFNQEEFKKDEFNEDARIEKKSVLLNKFTVSASPIFTEAWVEYNQLVDEVDLFQIGQ